MITFEEACKIASVTGLEYDYCSEWENGYVFSVDYNGPDEEPPMGGKHTPLVVLKEDGSRTAMPLFVMMGPGKFLDGIDMETGARIEIDEDDL